MKFKEEKPGILSTPASIVFYLTWIAFSILMLYHDYTHIIPYIIHPFSFSGFNPLLKTDTISLVWLILLFASLPALAPLLHKKALGLLGLLLFTGVCLKPFVIGKTPKETARQFVLTHKHQMKTIIKMYEQSGKSPAINKAVEKLDFEQLIVEGDTYIFIIDSLLDNSHGFFFDKNDHPPKHILNAHTWHKKLSKNWYVYSTT